MGVLSAWVIMSLMITKSAPSPQTTTVPFRLIVDQFSPVFFVLFYLYLQVWWFFRVLWVPEMPLSLVPSRRPQRWRFNEYCGRDEGLLFFSPSSIRPNTNSTTTYHEKYYQIIKDLSSLSLQVDNKKIQRKRQENTAENKSLISSSPSLSSRSDKSTRTTVD